MAAPGHTALLTMELQRGIVGDLSTIGPLADAVAAAGTLAATARLADAARTHGVAVVHATVSFRPGRRGAAANAPMLAAAARRPDHLATGSPSAELVPELGPAPDDLRSDRHHGVTPFTGTDLDALLRGLGVRTLVATGVSVNMGIFGLAIEAVGLGYQVIVVEDAVAGVPASYAADVLDHSIRLLATVRTVDDLVAAWRSGS